MTPACGRWSIAETYSYQRGSLKEGCTRTTTTVLAAEDVTGQGSDGEPLAIVSVVVLDTCAGTVKRNAYGAAVPKTLKVSGDLKTGSLVATVPVHDGAKDELRTQERRRPGVAGVLALSYYW